MGEDNKTIIHHKVAARVVCVFSEQDAHVAARAEQHQHQLQQQQQQQHSQHQQNPATSPASGAASGLGGRPPQPNGVGAFSFVPGSNTGARRPPVQPQGLGGMGGMGGGIGRPPGKSGLTFDHILSRLQGELQKSRETGAELHNLTGAMNDIHDTLGGSLVSKTPSAILFQQWLIILVATESTSLPFGSPSRSTLDPKSRSIRTIDIPCCTSHRTPVPTL